MDRNLGITFKDQTLITFCIARVAGKKPSTKRSPAGAKKGGKKTHAIKKAAPGAAVSKKVAPKRGGKKVSTKGKGKTGKRSTKKNARK